MPSSSTAHTTWNSAATRNGQAKSNSSNSGHANPHQHRAHLHRPGVIAGNGSVLGVGDRRRQDHADEGEHHVGCFAREDLRPEPPRGERKRQPEREVGPLVEPGPEVRSLAEPPRERAIEHVGHEPETEDDHEGRAAPCHASSQQNRRARDAKRAQHVRRVQPRLTLLPPAWRRAAARNSRKPGTERARACARPAGQPCPFGTGFTPNEVTQRDVERIRSGGREGSTDVGTRSRRRPRGRSPSEEEP